MINIRKTRALRTPHGELLPVTADLEEVDAWMAKDGILATDGSAGGWISTDAEYDDFELSLEFRISEGGNSGVFIRAPRQGDPAYTGMEIQILDDYAQKYADLKSWQYTASLYGVVPAKPGFSMAANQWQKMYVVCDGPIIKISLNGELVVDTNLIDHMWLEKHHPGLKRRGGFIGFQAHGSRVEYKNITIKELK